MPETPPTESEAPSAAISTDALSGARLRALIDARRAVLAELDHETILKEVLDAARALTGARYAAVGILGRERKRLERFVPIGVDAAPPQRIGDPASGRGGMGVLLGDP